MGTTRRLAAIMFTDIVGYTTLMGQDEETALDLISRNRALHKALIESYNGEWVKEMGDGTLASFHTSTDAVKCAGAIQMSAKQDGISLRIGLHVGEVAFDGKDVFGNGVNIASRIEALAPAEGIWVSEAVHKDVLNKKGIETTFVKEANLKNVSEPVKIYEASVEVFDSVPLQDKSPIFSKVKLARYLNVVAGIIILIALSYFVGAYFPNSSQIDTTSVEMAVAVLPFVDMSPDGDQGYLGDGMAEEILNILAKADDLTVIARTSSFQFKNEKVDARDVGRKLGVGYLVEGSVRKYGDKLRITAQLINCSKGAHVWSINWDKPFTDLFAIQDEIALSISNQLKKSLGIDQLTTHRATQNLQAYECFIKAQYLHANDIYIERDTSKFIIAEGLLLSAIEYDPDFAEAYAELANLYDTGINLFPNKSDLESMVHEYIDIAYQLNPNSATVNDAKGEIVLRRSGWEESYEFFVKAIELDPKTSSYPYIRLGTFLSRMGIYDESLKLIDRALEIDPLNNFFLGRRANTYYQMGLLDEAEADYIELQLRGQNVNGELCRLYSFKGESAKAEKYFNKFVESGYRTTREDYFHAFLLASQNDQSALKYNQNLEILVILGNYNEFFNYMEDVFERNHLWSSYYYLSVDSTSNKRIDPAFYDVYLPLRNQSRYAEMLESQKMRFDENIDKYSLRTTILQDER